MLGNNMVINCPFCDTGLMFNEWFLVCDKCGKVLINGGMLDFERKKDNERYNRRKVFYDD